MAVLSRFIKDPTVVPQLFSDEVALGAELIRSLMKVTAASKLVFVEGNHEYRIKTYFRERAPAFANKFSPEELLGLPTKTTYVPYGIKNLYKMPGLIATHGSIYNKHVASSMLNMFGCSVIFGHVHRFQRVASRNVHGEILQAISPGWLGDVEKAGGYITNAVCEWNHGFAFGHWRKNGASSLQTVLIADGQAFIGDKSYPKVS